MKYLKESNINIEDYLKWKQHRFGTGSGHRTSSRIDTKENIETETRNFFQSIIDETGNYALSDTVGDSYEDDEIKQSEMIAKADELKRKCEDVGLDIHEISQDVANDHFHFF